MLNFKSEKFLQLACVSIDPAYHFYLYKYIACVWTFFFIPQTERVKCTLHPGQSFCGGFHLCSVFIPEY